MEFNETVGFNHGGYIMGDWRRLRKNAGTHLLEKCSHDIDLACWMVESLPQRVASFGGLNFFVPENEKRIKEVGRDPRPDSRYSGREAYLAWQGLVAENPFTSDKDIFDNQVAIIEFNNAARATFHTNINAAIPERRMYLLGTEGALRADVLNGHIETQRIGFDSQLEIISSGTDNSHGGGDDVLATELADAMLYGRTPAVGINEGLISAATCFGIDEAADTRNVVVMQPYWEKIGKL